MKKIFIVFLAWFILAPIIGQAQRKFSAYLQAQYNHTIYDRTAGNNPWGMGLGLQTFYNTSSKFKPTVELTADIYLEDDKLLRATADGKPILDDLGGIVNLFAGASYQITPLTYVSLTGGPSFSNGRILFGIKPAFGFYFSAKQNWTGKLSFINIFNREELTHDDFGTINFSVGIKLF